MELGSKTTRETKIRLTNEEFSQAIRDYLTAKGVVDADQHLVLKVDETRDDRGYELDILLCNYNKDNNIHN